MTDVKSAKNDVCPCPWCLQPVAIAGVPGDPAAQFDPFLDDSGRLLGVRAGGHSCAGSSLYGRIVARASAS